MEFGIIHLYDEPQATLKISHKVDELLQQYINDIFVSQGLNQIKPAHYFTVYVTTESKRSHLEVRGPREIEDFIEYTIYFPYEEVVEAENTISAYLDFFLEGLMIVLGDYQIKTEVLNGVFEQVKQEVLNNTEYEYQTINEVLTYDDLQAFIQKQKGEK